MRALPCQRVAPALARAVGGDLDGLELCTDVAHVRHEQQPDAAGWKLLHRRPCPGLGTGPVRNTAAGDGGRARPGGPRIDDPHVRADRAGGRVLAVVEAVLDGKHRPEPIAEAGWPAVLVPADDLCTRGVVVETGALCGEP